MATVDGGLGISQAQRHRAISKNDLVNADPHLIVRTRNQLANNLLLSSCLVSRLSLSNKPVRAPNGGDLPLLTGIVAYVALVSSSFGMLVNGGEGGTGGMVVWQRRTRREVPSRVWRYDG